MRVRISGRSSDLSRIQMSQVAAAIGAAAPGAEVVEHHRESLGDRMLEDPLWKMPEKGVFTEDFVEDLRAGETDLVVHSWKDLPTEPRVGTRVVATLPRADVRDLLLMRRDLWMQVKAGARLSILSSSPRRAHNLTPFLQWALPVSGLSVDFVPVRGNVPTRLRKLLSGEHHGLIVAKAAIDRLLTSTAPEMAQMRDGVRTALGACLWMVLPVSQNPTGAAQGALAMEVSEWGNADVRALVESLNDRTTFAEASREREILRSYGGGCHQKIGVNVLTRPYGTIVSLRGLTDVGERLEQFTLEAERRTPKTTPDRIWVSDGEHSRRTAMAVERPGDRYLFVARADALPQDWNVENAVVWTAGLQTWRRLAERGVWVTGSAEGLGEQEDPRLDVLAGESTDWLKLTHDRADGAGRNRVLATYRVEPAEAPQDLSSYTHFFWTSGSQFIDAVDRQPEILQRWHACGPGNSHAAIAARLGGTGRLEVWLTQEQWRKDITQ